MVYSFAGGSDGAYPSAALTYVGGALYGTTSKGGAGGDGTVFKVTASGTESVLYSFAGGSDGAGPVANLTNVGGALYGTTTYGGGEINHGTVFRITTSGTETVLHRFGFPSDGAFNPSDGAYPDGNLTDVGGVLYGTTHEGGRPRGGDGAVFKITTSGTERVIHSFAGARGDGANPAGLTNMGGTLFGSTYQGGTGGYGTVFRITTSGAESVLYSFAGGRDGANPNSGLTSVGGVLYGTSQYGGTSPINLFTVGLGTVFSLSR